jgi:hypothetical protein
LADPDNRGSLQVDGFVIAMHLVTSFTQGVLRTLPNSLPGELYAAAKGQLPNATRILDSIQTRIQTMTINQTPSDSYPYCRLDFDSYEIRILKLNGSADESDPIVCSLEHASLIDPGPYVSLSYDVSISFFNWSSRIRLFSS